MRACGCYKVVIVRPPNGAERKMRSNSELAGAAIIDVQLREEGWFSATRCLRCWSSGFRYLACVRLRRFMYAGSSLVQGEAKM